MAHGNALPDREFRERLTAKFSGDITALEPYAAATIKMRFKCHCGWEWDSLPFNVMRNGGCPACAGESRRLGAADAVRMKSEKCAKEFRCRVFEKYGDLIEVLGEYVKANKPILLRCKCGKEFMCCPSNLLHSKNKKGCPWCSRSKSPEEYK